MTGWTQRQQALFFDLLDNGWPGELTPDQAKAYQTLLDGTDPEVVVGGLRRLLHRGQRFRPSAAELLGAANDDPSRPTFEEAYRLIFDVILKARPAQRAFHDVEDGERIIPAAHLKRRAEREAIKDAARQAHPLIAAFLQREGIERLRYLQLDDPDWGAKRREELRRSWDAHVEASTGRELAVLASGEGREGLRRLDPLAALPGGRAELPERAS